MSRDFRQFCSKTAQKMTWALKIGPSFWCQLRFLVRALVVDSSLQNYFAAVQPKLRTFKLFRRFLDRQSFRRTKVWLRIATYVFDSWSEPNGVLPQYGGITVCPIRQLVLDSKLQLLNSWRSALTLPIAVQISWSVHQLNWTNGSNFEFPLWMVKIVSTKSGPEMFFYGDDTPNKLFFDIFHKKWFCNGPTLF